MAFIAIGVLFAILMIVEAHIARRRGLKGYSRRATISSIATGLGALAAGLIVNIFGIYGVVSTHFGLVDWGPAPAAATWVASFLLLDFVFYWGHRICHVSPVFWSMHEVHHQSEEFNLAVGMRSPLLQPLMYAPFVFLLALSGIPLEIMAVTYLCQQVWKLLAHTEVVGSLGPLELFMATPRHHAVHHGDNAHFRGRNFGGLLIVWDRLFGTFQTLDEVPSYGLGRAPSYHPLEDNLVPLRRLLSTTRAKPSM